MQVRYRSNANRGDYACMGLIKRDGTEKLAYETWKSVSGR